VIATEPIFIKFMFNFVKKAYKKFPDNPTASVLADSRSDGEMEMIST